VSWIVGGLVSVVIPTYERNDLLFSRSLPSVLSQSYGRLEVHVVCDGMRGDPLKELMVGLNAVRDIRIKFWNIPHQEYPEDQQQKWMVLGLNARNYGLDQARGEWVTSLDDDDEWTPDHVEVLLDEARKSDADFVYGMSEYHWPDDHDQTAGKWPPGYGALCDGSQLYRNGLGYRYDPECIKRGLPEDGDLWNRMRDGGVSMSFLPQIVHHYYPNER
jgi:glycosyltransferase involved in cell wall biosynthesis